jgi:hypothetical protein
MTNLVGGCEIIDVLDLVKVKRVRHFIRKEMVSYALNAGLGEWFEIELDVGGKSASFSLPIMSWEKKVEELNNENC